MCAQAMSIQTVHGRNGPSREGYRPVASLLSWARDFVCLLILARALRKTRAELHDLDDRMLEDIGIQRSDIDRLLQTPKRWDEIRSPLDRTRALV